MIRQIGCAGNLIWFCYPGKYRRRRRLCPCHSNRLCSRIPLDMVHGRWRASEGRCTEHLLASENQELRLLNCAVINKEDKESFVWKTGHHKKITEVHSDEIKGIGHPFNGTLINHRIIARVGVSNSTSFSGAMKPNIITGLPGRTTSPWPMVTKSIHYHPATAFSLTKTGILKMAGNYITISVTVITFIKRNSTTDSW